jgi:hypothetical protein
MLMLMQMQCNYGAKHLRCYTAGLSQELIVLAQLDTAGLFQEPIVMHVLISLPVLNYWQ